MLNTRSIQIEICDNGVVMIVGYKNSTRVETLVYNDPIAAMKKLWVECFQGEWGDDVEILKKTRDE